MKKIISPSIKLFFIFLLFYTSVMSQNHGDKQTLTDSGFIIASRIIKPESLVEYFYLPISSFDNFKLRKYKKKDKKKNDFGYNLPVQQDSLMDWMGYDILSFSLIRNQANRITIGEGHLPLKNCFQSENLTTINQNTVDKLEDFVSIEGRIKNIFYSNKYLLADTIQLKGLLYSVFVVKASVKYCLSHLSNDQEKKFIKYAYVYELGNLSQLDSHEKSLLLSKIFKYQPSIK